jgi:hypothetical protein
MDIKVFADALAYRESLDPPFYERGRAINDEYAAATLALAKQRFPKRRFTTYLSASEALGEEGLALRAPFEARVKALQTEHAATVDAVNNRLDTLAAITDIPLLDELRLVTVSRASNWGSQTQPSKYAEVHAESRADIGRALGLRAEVRPTELHQIGGRYPCQHVDYGVFCNTSQAGWEVALRKGGDLVPLREWVLRCWRRGANPRVYYPWLPHDFEAKNGLHYGTDLRAAKATETA